MPVLTKRSTLTEANLVSLFMGDDDTTGYAHPALIRELCAIWRPKNIADLASRLYPELGHLSDLPKAVRVALREGLTLWRTE